jgi:ankyrin repeat protein
MQTDSINTALLGSAIFRNDLNTVQTLLESGTNPNTLHRANTPLMWAAGEGYNDICIALLNAGDETDRLNAANYTALIYAAESDRRDGVGTTK